MRMRTGLLIGGIPLLIALTVDWWSDVLVRNMGRQAAGEAIANLALLFGGAGYGLLLLILLPAIILGAASSIFGWGPVFLGLWLSGGRRR